MVEQILCIRFFRAQQREKNGNEKTGIDFVRDQRNQYIRVTFGFVQVVDLPE